jgi:hypothetical protein
MHATLTVEYKMSRRGDTKETSTHRNSHNRSSSELPEFIEVSHFLLFVCAVECSGERQCE